MSVLLQTKTIFETKLHGIVPWKCVQVNNQTTQFLSASIETPKGHAYILHVGSSYHAPPLGSIVLVDEASKHEIQGQNQDATWYKVVEYIKAKEDGSSAVAAAKVAEVVPEPMRAPVNVAPRDDDEPVIPPFPVVYFVAEKGEFFRNGPALVTKANPDGSLNLSVFADNSEVFSVQNIQKRSEALRNRCYVAYPPFSIPVMLGGDLSAEDEPIEAATPVGAVNLMRGMTGVTPAITGIPDAAPKRRGRPPKNTETTVLPQADADPDLEDLERLTAPDAA